MFLDNLKNAAIGLVAVGVLSVFAALLASPLLAPLADLTSATLAGVAGAILSVLQEKLPIFSKWFGGLDPVNKGWATGGSIVGLAVALFGAGCAGFLGAEIAIECSAAGAFGLLTLVFGAIVGNAGVYLMFVKPRKALRGAS